MNEENKAKIKPLSQINKIFSKPNPAKHVIVEQGAVGWVFCFFLSLSLSLAFLLVFHK